MGLLSRNQRPQAEPQVTSQNTSESVPAPLATTAQHNPAMGRYGPRVTVTRFDVAPAELEWQLPIHGELWRLMPGSDRPDYSLMVLERPLHVYPMQGLDPERVAPDLRTEDRKGRPLVRVDALVLCARFVGQQLHQGMVDLAVNLAYVVDNSLSGDQQVDFGKIAFAGVGFLTEGRVGDAPTLGQDQQPIEAESMSTGSTVPTVPTTPAEPTAAVHSVLDEAAICLRDGVAAQRGDPVHRLDATLMVGAGGQITGLTGNADGSAPVPTPATFARLSQLLARLPDNGREGRVVSVTLRVDNDSVSHEVAHET